MLQSLLLIWVLALDPEGAAGVYERELGYQRGESGWLQADLAAAMERPELAGRPFQTVYPPRGSAGGYSLGTGRQQRVPIHGTPGLECHRIPGARSG